MADRATLLALAERIEAATGPDRELDAAIQIACGWTTASGLPASKGCLGINAFTSSLDAALTLVPEGWGGVVPVGASPPRNLYCVLVQDFADGTVEATAATPALALSAAALRAIAGESQ